MQILMMAGTVPFYELALRKLGQSPKFPPGDSPQNRDSPLIGVKSGVKVGILSRNGVESRPLRQHPHHVIARSSETTEAIPNPYNPRRQISTVKGEGWSMLITYGRKILT